MGIRFSILIPVYNVEDYVRVCLQSILDQTYQDFEIIIIDDGSTDQSGQICDDYVSDTIKVYHQKNCGLLATRRKAIQYAKGDYCLFVDSDDVIDKNTLEILNDTILRFQSDLVIFNRLLFTRKDFTDKIILKPVFENNKQFIGEGKKELYWNFLTTGDLNNLVIKCVRTDIIKSDKTNYADYNYLTLGEDRFQSFHLIDQACSIIYLSDPLYYYRQNDNSMTHKIDNSRIDTFYKIMDKTLVDCCLKYSKKWGFTSEIEKYAIFNGLFIRKMDSFNFVWDRCDPSSKKQWICKDWASTFSDEMLIDFYKKRLDIPLKQYIQIYCMLKHKYYLRRLIDIFKKK